MGRMHTKDTVKIEKIRYFYQKSESDTVADFYERYLQDPSRKMQIDGMVFYRIIMLDRLTRQDKWEYLAVTERMTNPTVGDMLTDEHGNRFTVTAFPMFTPVRDGRDARITGTMQFLFRGAAAVGEYLAVLPRG